MAESDYQVESILDVRTNSQTQNTECLIKWAGYSHIWNTWEPEELAVAECPDLLDEFWKRNCHLQITKSAHDHYRDSEKPRSSSGSKPAQPKALSGQERIPPALPSPAARTGSKQALMLAFEKMLNAASPGCAPITVVNNIDDAPPPPDFRCINAPVYGRGVPVPNPSFLVGCECTSAADGSGQLGCGPSCPCISQDDGSTAVYSPTGQLLIETGPIYECNSKCLCSSSCRNRVVQLGRQVPLAVQRYGPEKGWGVAAMSDIPRGTFVEIYLGEVITADEASRRVAASPSEGGRYLFDLDFNYEAGVESEFTVDAARYGNISHFFNHSCDPNLRVHACFIETWDPRLHHLAFFTLRDVKRGEELCFDYLCAAATQPATVSRLPRKPRRARLECFCQTARCRSYIY